VRLEVADEARYVARDVASFEVWGDGQTLADFVANEAAMRRSAWSRGARTGWLWTDRDRVLASCETYRLPCTGGVAWEIASVYTEPALRGRGHASALLSALADRLGAEPEARALVLFSDVGAALYERLGFAARPAFDRVVPAAPGPLAATAPGALGFPSSGAFRIDPDAAQLAWHVERRILLGSPMKRWSAATADGALAWIDPGDELLLLDARFDGDPEALLAVAAAVAARFALTRVRAWETPEWPAELGERIPRVGNLPMIRTLRPFDPHGWTRVPRAVWV
jgi:ribosomal protein S18 acetylase RimI-like enzyme